MRLWRRWQKFPRRMKVTVPSMTYLVISENRAKNRFCETTQTIQAQGATKVLKA